MATKIIVEMDAENKWILLSSDDGTNKKKVTLCLDDLPNDADVKFQKVTLCVDGAEQEGYILMWTSGNQNA